MKILGDRKMIWAEGARARPPLVLLLCGPAGKTGRLVSRPPDLAQGILDPSVAHGLARTYCAYRIYGTV